MTRRANALALLDKGWSCQEVAHAFLLDDDTIRGWRKLFEHRGFEGLITFDGGGSTSFLSTKQEDDLKAWVGAMLPRSTRQIGAWIKQEFGLVYESRSGLIALPHCLGLECHKPDVIPRKLDEAKQKAFIESDDKHLNCKRLGFRFRSLSLEIATRHSYQGGEFGERIDPVKDAKHRLRRREQGSRP